MLIQVATQAELDAALANGNYNDIEIRSPRGTWLRLADTGNHYVRASGSATVRASGSATVEAYDSATVEAYDSATVRAYDSATVEASGSATVRASGSATVRASGSATVEASGSATVHGHHNASVTAGAFVAVHKHHRHVKITGGVLIDVSALDLESLETWVDYTGSERSDAGIILFKATNENLEAGQDYGRVTRYTPGETVECTDWDNSNDCGGGLHFSPTPAQAADYRRDAKRFLKVVVRPEDLRSIVGGTAKAKARRCTVLEEVDIHGRPVGQS